MARGKKLTEKEIGKIEALHKRNISIKKIAEELKRSRHVILNYLKNPNTYGKKHSSGRKRKLSKQDERRIARKASNSTKSLVQIKSELQLDVHKTTIWRSLKRNSFITYERMNKAPRLLQRHKDSRLEFARQNMDRDWKLVS